jgi:hypothetical protein
MVQTTPPNYQPGAHQHHEINDFAFDAGVRSNVSKCPHNNIIANGAVLVSAPLRQLIVAVLGAQPSFLPTDACQ